MTIKVSSKPLHDGRVDPMLFGNHIELLDDLVPGMWAEMLNDRGSESFRLFVVNLRREFNTVSRELAKFGENLTSLSVESVCDILDMRQPEITMHETGAESAKAKRTKTSGGTITVPSLSDSAIESGKLPNLSPGREAPGTPPKHRFASRRGSCVCTSALPSLKLPRFGNLLLPC